MAYCISLTKAGRPCRGAAIKNGLCYQHDLERGIGVSRHPVASTVRSLSPTPPPESPIARARFDPMPQQPCVVTHARSAVRLGLLGGALWAAVAVVTGVAETVSPDAGWVEPLRWLNAWLGAASLVVLATGIVVWPIESMSVRIARWWSRLSGRTSVLPPSNDAASAPAIVPEAVLVPEPLARDFPAPAPLSTRSQVVPARSLSTSEPDRGLLPKYTRVRTYRSVRGRWDYEPCGEVLVLDVVDTSIRAEITLEEFTSLQAAIDRFVEIALPVQWHWTARVMDSNLASVIAYRKATDTACVGDDGMWDGCQAGFDALRRTGRVNEVDVAIWESLAQRMEVW